MSAGAPKEGAKLGLKKIKTTGHNGISDMY